MRTNINDIFPSDFDINNDMDFNIVKKAFQNSWMVETSANMFQEKAKRNIAAGQCVPTSLIFQDYFGGIIMRGELYNGDHFYNIINGELFDLTKEQFNNDIRCVDTNQCLKYVKEPQEVTRHTLIDDAENRLQLYKYNLLRVGFATHLKLQLKFCNRQSITYNPSYSNKT